MNEEIPYNPPGLDEYIRDSARKNSALLRKMQGKPEAVETAKAQGQFAPCPGSVAAGICLHCDYWTLRSTDGTGGMQGWCDLFVKRTPANHGRKCTGWTPREPLNDLRELPPTGDSRESKTL